MRVAVTSECPIGGAGGGAVAAGWAERLVRGLPEHEFVFVAASEVPCGGSAPRGAARRRSLDAYEELLHALIGSGPGQAVTGPSGAPSAGRSRTPAGPPAGGRPVTGAETWGEERFAAALRALAREARGGGLPALLRSAAAERVLESVWRTSAAEAAGGEPTVRDALHATALLERCLRPLSGPWFGGSSRRGPVVDLAGADLCHAVGGGLAVLPALLARWAFGTPLIVTEFRPELRERLAALSASAYRRPVRALVAAFLQALAAEGYRQAGVVTAGSAYVARWQREGGAQAARQHVVPEGLVLPERAAGRLRAPGMPERRRPECERPSPAGADGAGGGVPEQPRGERPVLRCAEQVSGPALEVLRQALEVIGESVPGARVVLSEPCGTHGSGAHAPAAPDRSARVPGPHGPGGRGPRAGGMGGRDRGGGGARESVAGGASADSPPPAPGAPAPPRVLGAAAAGEDLGAATVVLLPALDRPDPAPLARAMLSGLPVVATDTGATRELLGPTGLLVPPGDPGALAAACTALLRDEERCRRLGLAARLRVRERFDAAGAVDAFRGRYLDLVAHSGAYPSPVPCEGGPRLFARPVEFWLGAAAATRGEAS